MAAAPTALRAQEHIALNVITHVSAKGSTVEIIGSHKPNFTTFTLRTPPQVVIDISEAVFSGVPEKQKVNTSNIISIEALAFRNEASAIARIQINLKRNAEATIATSGMALQVQLPHNVAEDSMYAQIQTAPQQQTNRKNPGAPLEAQRKSPHDVAGDNIRAQIQTAPQQQTNRSNSVAPLEAQRKSPHDVAGDNMRAQIQTAPQQQTNRSNSVETIGFKKWNSKVTKAKEKAAELNAEKARQLQLVAARTPPPAALLASNKKARIISVGFKQHNGVGKIFLRTTSAVPYSVNRHADRHVVVTLEGTRIALPNNERILDTSFFDTAVSFVKPEEIANERVRITINLKQAVTFQARQRGNELVLAFERPPPPPGR